MAYLEARVRNDSLKSMEGHLLSQRWLAYLSIFLHLLLDLLATPSAIFPSMEMASLNLHL